MGDNDRLEPVGSVTACEGFLIRVLERWEPGGIAGSWHSLGFYAECQNPGGEEQFALGRFPNEATARRNAEAEVRRRLSEVR